MSCLRSGATEAPMRLRGACSWRWINSIAAGSAQCHTTPSEADTRLPRSTTAMRSLDTSSLRCCLLTDVTVRKKTPANTQKKRICKEKRRQSRSVSSGVQSVHNGKSSSSFGRWSHGPSTLHIRPAVRLAPVFQDFVVFWRPTVAPNNTDACKMIGCVRGDTRRWIFK